MVAYGVPSTAVPRTVGRARVSVASANRAAVAPNTDDVTVKDSLVADCAAFTKALSRTSGDLV